MSIIIDIVFVLFLVLVFYLGYRKGFLTKAWWLVDLALIAIVGFLLSSTIFNAIKNNTGWYTGLADSLASFEDNLNIQAEEIAEFIIRLGIWIVLGIAVIIVMAIVKWLLRKLSCYKAFEIIDKILGGVYSVLINCSHISCYRRACRHVRRVRPRSEGERFLCGQLRVQVHFRRESVPELFRRASAIGHVVAEYFITKCICALRIFPKGAVFMQGEKKMRKGKIFKFG